MSLSGKSLGELRTIAKSLGISVAGLNAAALVKEIEKKKGKSSSKEEPKTKVKPKVKSAPEPDEEETDEDEPEEEEDDTPKPVAKKTAAPPDDMVKKVLAGLEAIGKIEKGVEKYQTKVNILEAVVVALAKAVGEEGVLPESLKPAKVKNKPVVTEDEDEPEEEEEGDDEPTPPKKAVKKPEPDDDEEEEEEDEEEEDDDPKPAAKKKSVKPDPEEEEEEETDEDELELSPETLASMNLGAMKELAEKINESGQGEEEDNIDYEDVTSPRILRERIKAWMQKYAEVDTQDEPKSKEKTSSVRPDWLQVGKTVEMQTSDDEDDPEWLKGVVSSVDDKKKTADVEGDDGQEYEAVWADLRKGSISRKVAK